MKILAVEQPESREQLEAILRQAAPEADITVVSGLEQAMELAHTDCPDVAMVSVDAQTMTLIEALRKITPNWNFIFLAENDDFAGRAFRLHASGYLVRPVTAEQIAAELNCLRYGPERRAQTRLFARTFGNFEIYLDGAPLHFSYSKTKELLAYLIDRCGAMCSMQELASVLWENDPADRHTSYLNNLRTDLRFTLSNCGCGDVLIVRRGQLGVNPDAFRCDYYDYLAADDSPAGQRIRSAYRGEYMAQYTWAEYTNSRLTFAE